MEAQSQVPFDHETYTQHDDVFVKDVITSETNHVPSDQPVKKRSRQWAAWTRQEEESFFTALRQVGKNFEKITSRVPSKNKDQVRHYYYRLVRRMNKLLGPELTLDAKNSKDTNAAMLRWWSLLQKHSCKASKLHLKPRRFKIFLETLVNQLSKDQKKNTRKRPKQGGNSSTARQRRRPGKTSTDAYKKWEKAAKAGVSLVADAAEHLERTALHKLADSVQNVQGNKGSDLTAKSIPRVPDFCQNIKLKLQLFPVDESTRRALETDNYNPHLELTLSTRKKISSVLERMNCKWGSSSVASGELTLVPYDVQTLNITNCQKWTQDSVLSAGDIYAAIGSPPIFRLRYGWFGKADCISTPIQDHKVTLEWADSQTNISVGDLLSELSHNPDANCMGPPLPPGSPCQSQVSFSCDSFDAAIAAHIKQHHGKNAFQPTVATSIWNAEETCDAFSFPKNSAPSGSLIEKSVEQEELKDGYPEEVNSMDECRFVGNIENGSAKDIRSLTDIYWPDSLGPLDLDASSCRYTNDVIFSDSLGGLNCLINSSLDSFQNCSFFGLGKKETALIAGAGETASSSGYKADSKV
uniref:TSL-kinase interacting protein 1 n=1 Tax=Erigeron canadensis TaxID=72917 RepID=UPI001CB92C9F|nr:TSL-kinase interacting protein 1 [Erigeron canadensis]XP_043610446.1 TSL-kinase interacting protein 1 [Erigeron canadensis]